MARGTSVGKGEALLRAAARKTGAALEETGEKLRKYADTPKAKTGAANLNSVEALPAPKYSVPTDVAEYEFIAKRQQLGKTRGGWQAIGGSANAMTYLAIKEFHEADGRPPLSEQQGRQLMNAGVIRSVAPGYENQIDQLFPPPAQQAHRNEPRDFEDLARCEVTYHLAPAHLRPYMLPRLKQWRRMITGDEDKVVGLDLETGGDLRRIFYPGA